MNPLCCGKKIKIATKNNFNLYKCKSNSLVFLDPIPKSEDLISQLYSSSVGYHSQLPLDLSKTKPSKKYREIMKYLSSYKEKSKLLDVGCSNGEFMWLAHEKGFKVNGVEVNKDSARIAQKNGLEVFCGFLEDAKFKKNKFDIIHLGDVIEHVTRPDLLIKECNRILKPQGLLVISTPNLDCFWSRGGYMLYKFFKIPWSAVEPPLHTYQFSLSTLAILLRKEKIKIVKELYFLPSLPYELGSSFPTKNITSLVSLLKAILIYSLYSLLYLVNFISKPLRKKEIRMTVFCKKMRKHKRK